MSQPERSEGARLESDAGIEERFAVADADRARGEYAEALARYREIIDAVGGAEPHCSRACAGAAACLVELGDAGGALAILDRGARAAEAARHVEGEIVDAGVRGGVLASVGRTAEAMALLEATAAACRQRGLESPLPQVLHHLAAAYLAARRSAEAITTARESIALQATARTDASPVGPLITLGAAYGQLGDLGAAESTLREALDGARSRGERALEGWALLMSAEIALGRGERAAALDVIDEAQEIAEELAMRPLLERCRAALRRAAGGA